MCKIHEPGSVTTQRHTRILTSCAKEGRAQGQRKLVTILLCPRPVRWFWSPETQSPSLQKCADFHRLSHFHSEAQLDVISHAKQHSNKATPKTKSNEEKKFNLCILQLISYSTTHTSVRKWGTSITVSLIIPGKRFSKQWPYVNSFQIFPAEPQILGVETR